MEYYKIDVQNPNKKLVNRAVQVLQNGGIIAYPTDTLYGLGVDYFSEKALNKLYMLKQRDGKLPISMMVYSIEQMAQLFGVISDEQTQHLNKILPGKYTALVESRIKKPLTFIDYQTSNNTIRKKIGFRIPDTMLCSELTRKLGGPISTTSANISGKGNVLSIKEVVAHFGDRLDLILDGGPMKNIKGSTVIDFTKKPYLITRLGEVSLKRIKEQLPDTGFRVKRKKYLINFICSGNICRSPLGEYILKSVVKKTKYRNIIDVKSAGTLDLQNSPAHDLSIDVGKENNLELTPHRSRHITKKIVNESDLIICMATNHFEFFKKKFPEYMHKIILIKQWKINQPLTIPSIADPIGHDKPFFRQTFFEIQQEIKRILPYILADVKKFVEYNELPTD